MARIQSAPLRVRLPAAFSASASVSAAKPTSSFGRCFARGEIGEDVGSPLPVEGGRPVLFLELVRRRLDPPVGDSRDQNCRVGGEGGGYRMVHLLRRLDVDSSDPRRRREADRAGDQGHPRAERRQRAGDREALFARGAVGDHAHRVDRLLGWAGGDQDMPAGERAGAAERGLDRGQDRLGLGQAPRAIFAARHFAFVGLEDGDAVLPEPRDVAPGRRMLPHPHVHRRRGEHPFVGGEKEGGREVVGDPRRHLGEEIGGRWTDDHQIGLAAQLDMPHLDFVLEVPETGVDRLLGQGRERHRRHEPLAARGQHAAHAPAGLADQPNQLARLIGRDPAADDEKDTLALHRPKLGTKSPPRQPRRPARRR